ncbi:MAG: IMPACT family protein [Campylobacteraceae bacterium]|jgi:uncharacterized YigZ family protein|nr:IMPACT family protein [Campylobacteraceae bacterium]
MQTLNEINFYRYEIKKSIFIAFAAPISGFDALHVKLKAEHPKAAHVVWAYRKLNEYNQTVENGSDDGEPKGTSAQPILSVLRGAEFINVCVLIVRYFGGVKLGTGGLVRAYQTAAKMVLGEAKAYLYEQKEEFVFSSKYSFTPKIEYFLQKTGITFENRDFNTDNITWKIQVTKAQKEELERFLEKINYL